ncbi:MAG: carbonic anhydrase [Planctomycetota bacterium]
MRAATRLGAAGIAALLLGSACAPGALRHPYFHREEQPRAVEWGYGGADGPARWAELSPSYHLARDGREQSPIDLRGAQRADLAPLRFDYRPVSVRLVYNGHSVQEDEDGASHLVVGEDAYELKQFHFHSPSEHTVDGRLFEMEVHFVHESAAGEVAVVSVLVERGAHNAAFDSMWRALPDRDHPTGRSEERVEVASLLPAAPDYFAYRGSFTTPPCTEGVRWFVMRQPIQLAPAQLATFRRVIYGNNRPVQPQNGRAISSSRSAPPR